MKRYRAEIDGLRAIAVVLVVLFHLTFTAFGAGGFIGVDVFFVISGYLITAHLRSDLRENFRGVVEFYRRRIVRIFPALFAIYFLCIALELCLQFASQLRSFQHVTLSSIFFGSNFYLLETTGYFDFRAKTNPLIHTWSLSIEEQFYIFLPLLLFVCRKRPPREQIGWLAFLTILSLAASQYFLQQDARLSFYVMPLRAWELLIGSLLSYGVAGPLRRPWASEIAAVIGLALILYSALALNAGSSFPGFAALPAVVGSGLILSATEVAAPIFRTVLGWAPFRFIGQISYSLYLWHWPLIVYARYYWPLETKGEKLALIAVSIMLATLSWLLIEQPVRRRARQITAKMALYAGGGAMLATASFVLAMPPVHHILWPSSLKADRLLISMDHYDPSTGWREGRCILISEQIANEKLAPECLRIDRKAPNVLVLGDSHAAMIWFGLSRQFPNVNFLQASAASCEPFNNNGSSACKKLMDGIVDGFLPEHHLDGVILSVLWKPDDVKRLPSLIARLKKVANHIYVFGPNRWYTLPFPEVVARAIYSRDIGTVKRFEQHGVKELDAALARATRTAGGTYVSMYDLMCNNGCWTLDRSGMPVMYDYDHLSAAGSEMMAAALPANFFLNLKTAVPEPEGIAPSSTSTGSRESMRREKRPS